MESDGEPLAILDVAKPDAMLDVAMPDVASDAETVVSDAGTDMAVSSDVDSDGEFAWEAQVVEVPGARMTFQDHHGGPMCNLPFFVLLLVFLLFYFLKNHFCMEQLILAITNLDTTLHKTNNLSIKCFFTKK